MEPKRILNFEFKKDDRVYNLQMPEGAPLSEAYEASLHFLSGFVKMINEHAEKMKPIEVEEEAKSEE